MGTEDLISHQRMVDLAEFDRLREEIDNRTQLSNTLVLGDIAALGTGIALVSQLPEVLLGLAALSSFLWLLWLDHTEQIYKIASYIGLRLSPRLCREGEDLLGWEKFLRMVDRGGGEAAKALYGGPAPEELVSRIRIRPTRYITFYIMILFGLSPLVFLMAYTILVLQGSQASDPTYWLRLGGIGLSLLVWIFSWHQYWLFNQSIRSLSEPFFGSPAKQ